MNVYYSCHREDGVFEADDNIPVEEACENFARKYCETYSRYSHLYKTKIFKFYREDTRAFIAKIDLTIETSLNKKRKNK